MEAGWRYGGEWFLLGNLNWQKKIRDGLMLDGLAGHVAASWQKKLEKTLEKHQKNIGSYSRKLQLGFWEYPQKPVIL